MLISNSLTIGLIEPFDDLKLPMFSVVTGLNGAGKSQLLRGIATGSIWTSATDSVRTDPSEIVLLTNTDPEPDGLVATRTASADAILKTPVSAIHALEIVQKALNEREEAKKLIEQRITAATGKSVEDLGLDWRQLISFMGQPGAPIDNRLITVDIAELAEIGQQAGLRLQSILQDYRQSTALPSTIPVAVATPVHYLNWDRHQLAAMLGWVEDSLFTPDVVTTFIEYRNKRWRELVQRQIDAADGTSVALGDEGFEKAFGSPPWDSVTEALQNFGLPYRVVAPPTGPQHDVVFSLVRDGAETPLTYQDLSSGERVLMRMVLASFQANDERLNVRPPKLILLDELDASLHPANVRRWLEAIQTGYVEAMGISCILTTHSPTTVALAPEDSIFEMTAENPRPVQISKQHAIDRLTAGLPMLAIDYSARRQVFTESTIDVDHYSMLHDIMRPQLAMDRTLSFVGTSTKGSCTFVYNMVEHMEKNGNRSVFGIVDWDTSNAPTRRVKVLASGTHYAKDNVLLDPLLIGALLLKGDDLKLDPPIRYTDLRGASVENLQRLSDLVVERVKYPPAANKTIAKNQYQGGLELNVRESYQRMQGHDLEQAIKKEFPMLEGRYRAEGALISAIISKVVADFPEFCPKPISDLFTELAVCEP